MDAQLFSDIGLGPRELSIYRALLALGPSSIRTIADRSGINRGTTYESLKQMQVQGIVTYLPKGKRRIFTAREPEVLLDLAEERRKRLDSAVDELKKRLIPELHQLTPDFSAANVQWFEGDDGIEQVLRDILARVGEAKDPVYSVFSSKPIRKHLYRPFPNFTAQRVAREIKVKVIAIGDGGESADYSERKWIKTEGPVDAAYIAIYPPRVAIISLASENYPTAVVIDSKEVAAAQQIIFDTLWRLL
ncbi:TrmB family transcriptional regulator [Marinobacterium sp. LSUCC0821]|jgi:sugar-specific transcriptional regulator TrmB|uniref:TrmB family transcriptional regulator n=1 Tax=Marinobacterium sp. LSUCC0821 TaxID=2668067 RepID=UPI0014525661|nr:TrmB family transcriptional regulator [Marinobacterium sp. LSUCC0821]QJD71875.1 TrmB family transcriptional regulator [Marinobacterium sp. LSUCC0821]